MSVIAQALTMAFANSSRKIAKAGEVVLTTAGFVDWTVPDDVYLVSVLMIAGGTGNNSLTFTGSGTCIFNTTMIAYGSNGRTGGSYAGADGGGRGGNGGMGYTWSVSGYPDDYIGGGGGGAGGYSGNGGPGQDANQAAGAWGCPGGGVGIYGQGSSGAQVWGTTSNAGTGGAASGGNTGAAYPRVGGKGGSGGSDGPSPVTGSDPAGTYGQYGGGYGGYGGRSYNNTDGCGGGGLAWKNNISVTPGQIIRIKVGSLGVVRIIWYGNRSFPLNAPKV